MIPESLDCAGRELCLQRAALMGILNVTPDSFSDGGLFTDVSAAVRHARSMVDEGADIIDIGGESTRPGARPVPLQQELDRVVPVVEAVCDAVPVPVSIDTSQPRVMQAAVAAGAGMINDVRALAHPGALQAAAEAGVPVCLTHMRGEPATMQRDPRYDDVIAAVGEHLAARRRACVEAGIDPTRILLDPGFGFGKSAAHNVELLRGLDRLTGLGAPLLVGLSRKSFLGYTLGLAPGERLHASVALALFALARGARVLRVHDVGPTRDAVRAWESIAGRGAGGDAAVTAAGAAAGPVGDVAGCGSAHGG